MARGRWVSDEERGQILQMRQEGIPVATIAVQLKRSQHFVYRILKESIENGSNSSANAAPSKSKYSASNKKQKMGMTAALDAIPHVVPLEQDVLVVEEQNESMKTVMPHTIVPEHVAAIGQTLKTRNLEAFADNVIGTVLSTPSILSGNGLATLPSGHRESQRENYQQVKNAFMSNQPMVDTPEIPRRMTETEVNLIQTHQTGFSSIITDSSSDVVPHGQLRPSVMKRPARLVLSSSQRSTESSDNLTACTSQRSNGSTATLTSSQPESSLSNEPNRQNGTANLAEQLQGRKTSNHGHPTNILQSHTVQSDESSVAPDYVLSQHREIISSATDDSLLELFDDLNKHVQKFQVAHEIDIHRAKLLQLMIKFQAEARLICLERKHEEITQKRMVSGNPKITEIEKLLREILTREITFMNLQIERKQADLERK